MPTASAWSWSPPAPALGSRIPVPDWFRHRHFFHSGTCLTRCRAVRHPSHSNCRWWKRIHSTHPARARPYKAAAGVILALWCWKNYKEMSDAGCRGKGNSSSAFYLLVNCLNPASAFWHQRQSGAAGHGLFLQLAHFLFFKGTQDWDFFGFDFEICIISLLVMSKY